MKTSSRSVHCCIDASIEAVGEVVTSERKSKAAGFVSEPQECPLATGELLEGFCFEPFAVYASNSDILNGAVVCNAVNRGVVGDL